MTPRTTIAAALVLFSCGGTGAPAHDTHAIPSATASSTAPQRAKRAPSAEIAKYFSADRRTMVAYVDVAGFLGTQLGGRMIGNVGMFTPDLATTDCVLMASHAVRELVFATYAEGSLGAIRYDAQSFDAKPCFSGALVPVAPGVALFGTLAPRAQREGGSLPASVALGDGEWLRVSFDDKPVRGTASLDVSDALFALHAEADMPEQGARDLVQQFEDSRAKVPAMMKEASSDERDAITKVLRFTTFRRDGGHVTFAIDLHEPGADQARDVGTMAALAIAGVRKYLLRSKEAEALNTVPAIARSIAASWERETLSSNLKAPIVKKKLQSFPPIPPIVPRGTKYQSSEKEWATWSTIKFEIDQPQYYQYEVRAAKDGESAEVIARGDLNGDGKTSSFVIAIKVKKDKDRTLEISQIVQTDPDE